MKVLDTKFLAKFRDDNGITSDEEAIDRISQLIENQKKLIDLSGKIEFDEEYLKQLYPEK